MYGYSSLDTWESKDFENMENRVAAEMYGYSNSDTSETNVYEIIGIILTFGCTVTMIVLVKCCIYRCCKSKKKTRTLPLHQPRSGTTTNGQPTSHLTSANGITQGVSYPPNTTHPPLQPSSGATTLPYPNSMGYVQKQAHYTHGPNPMQMPQPNFAQRTRLLAAN
ncbi:uncharacterized protein LOC128199386 isoform X1 [Bicyclus anynana]|uniref:Uncharacterized protein LOC112054952 isoform X1 n=1 Tax=Bicyclus anynana TaxID=110368 RepID=A0A6J1NZ92_BICAN|nr:uncharacterized protein LOC112054952 isoform X1 [Bicyclus anynana]XP_023950677.1 uncharacterized protein LOC112054952 isoform X1 [Bicyclus anynana]XP_052744668.1 uncharacterized protein LOC128199386 isoform X1 [Bicyclus anynana]XP_052744671.1 uncharacterized protein LOC128199386 isoform X1 [Bicyclus anynana]